MHRLLIVDDERIHRIGLADLLRQIKPDYLVFEAENGAAALELMDAMPFDLVLTDIRMPVMDGLSFLSLAKERQPETRVAILSAYGLFDYAQKSVSLGADDYLLKPVDPDELRACLDRMENRLEQDSLFRRDNVETTLYRFMTHSLDGEGYSSLRKLFGHGDSGTALHIRPDTHSAWPSAEQLGAFQIRLRKRLKHLGRVVVFRSPADKDVFITLAAVPGNSLRLVTRDAGDEAELLYRECGIRLVIGSSSAETNFFGRMEELHTYAMGACAARFYKPDCHVFDTGDNPPFDISPPAMDIPFQSISACLSSDDPGGAFDLFEKSLRHLIPHAHPGKLKEVTMISYMFFAGNDMFRLAPQVKERLFSQINATALEASRVDVMLGCVRDAFSNLADAVSEAKGAATVKREPVFETVTRYITGSLSMNLSMNDVARRFHYHPTYFSEMFKKYVGVGFSEYLQDIRLKEAAKLLKTTDRYAHDIAKAVGYRNAAYFTKAFKKQYGVSPDQYRKSI